MRPIAPAEMTLLGALMGLLPCDDEPPPASDTPPTPPVVVLSSPPGENSLSLGVVVPPVCWGEQDRLGEPAALNWSMSSVLHVSMLRASAIILGSRESSSMFSQTIMLGRREWGRASDWTREMSRPSTWFFREAKDETSKF